MDKLILNKLYDPTEYANPEVQDLVKKLMSFCNINSLQYAPLKWFEYFYALNYLKGKILDIGSAQSILPYYMAALGYDVTTLDLEDSEFRETIGKKFNVAVVTDDLQNYRPKLSKKFDLITNLSVIEHINEDTKAILNIADYLAPNGVMVISTDFYQRYIEYPDANRTIVTDRPPGSHCDSRTYTPETFIQRILTPLENINIKRIGETDYKNINILDPTQLAVRGLYTFGIAMVKNG